MPDTLRRSANASPGPKGSSRRSEAVSRGRTRIMLLVGLVLTLVLYGVDLLRPLAYPLILISTLAHEMGHGLTALFVGASFDRFTIWPDASGVAQWSGSVGRLGRAAVAAGGLIGPAAAAAVGFALARTARGARGLMLGAGIGLILAMVLVVRGLFAWGFVGVLAALCLWMARWKNTEVTQLAVVFLALQLALSVFSRGDYLFTDVAQTSDGAMPSDVAHMAEALWLPYWFWGSLCGVISVVAVAFGIRVFWR